MKRNLNTKYFHKFVKYRKARNHISFFKSDDGFKVENGDEISNCFVD